MLGPSGELDAGVPCPAPPLVDGNEAVAGVDYPLQVNHHPLERLDPASRRLSTFSRDIASPSIAQVDRLSKIRRAARR
jgi:hypothetical protein